MLKDKAQRSEERLHVRGDHQKQLGKERKYDGGTCLRGRDANTKALSNYIHSSVSTI